MIARTGAGSWVRAAQEAGEGDWYFSVESDVYGREEYGPYDTQAEAEAGMGRVRAKAEALADGVEREYSEAYRGRREWGVSDDAITR